MHSFEQEIVIPEALQQKSFSLEEHLFRFRPDRDFLANVDGKDELINPCIEEIKSRTIWHSAIGALNDPFEIYAQKNPNEYKEMTLEQRQRLWLKFAPARKSTPGLFAYSKQVLDDDFACEESLLEQAIEQTHQKNTFDDFIAELRQDIAIASFTAVCDSRLMWGYYCNGLSGICIIYNRERLKKNGIDPRAVNYIDGPFKINVLDFVTHYDDDERIEALEKMALSKHIEWKHEHEYRNQIVLPEEFKGCGKNIILMDNCIDGVIIGKRVREEVKTQIRKLCKKKFKVFMADVDYKLFKVKIFQ